MPVEASVAIVVNCRTSPPARSMIHNWFSPERFDSNRMLRPSGLKRGWRSFFVVVVSCRGARAAGRGPSQIVDELLFAARSTDRRHRPPAYRRGSFADRQTA